jgi:hypothetical protein
MIAVSLLLCMLPACVRRTMTITTEPSQALVFINGEEAGRSPVQTDFLWYGDYEITIRKEGYQTLRTNWVVDAPWYQVVPLDFFFEVLWPRELHDERSASFALERQEAPNVEELAARAEALRGQTIPFKD